MQRTSISVINTSEEVAGALADALGEDFDVSIGYVVDFREGRTDLSDFLRRHDPRVIVWDIAIPYDINWSYFAEARRRPECADRGFVVTTTNKRVLEELVGPTEAYEIVGKPYDLSMITGAVRRALEKLGSKTANGPRH